VTSAYISVAVPVPGLGFLTYRVPADRPGPPRGARVLVSVGARQLTGCVVRTDVLPPTDVDVRDVDAVLDVEPFLPEAVIDLALWTADYYASGPGDAIAAALPPLATIESERRVSLTAEGRARLVEPLDETAASSVLLRALATGQAFSVRELSSRVPEPAGLSHSLRQLAKEGLVSFARELRGRASAFRQVRLATLTTAGQALLEASGTEPPSGGETLGSRQREALEALAGSPGGIDTRQLRNRGVGSDTLRRLAARGLVTIGLTGRDGGETGGLVDVHVNVPDPSTPRVQEVHRTLLHVLCELIEQKL